MKFNRILITLLLAATMLMSACSQVTTTDPPEVDQPPATAAPDDQPTEVPAAEEPQAAANPVSVTEPVTISVWHVWGGSRLEMMDKQIADFQALYPNITVEHTLLDQADMAEKYLTAIASGNPPDVIMVHAARFFQAFADEGALIPLDDYIARDQLDVSVFYPSDFETYVYEGTTYGLPLATGTGSYVFHIDEDAFLAAGLDPTKPPTTWQELKDYAQKLTIKEGDKFVQIGFNPVGGENYPFKEWLFLNNGKLISDDGKQILFNSEEGLDTLNWMVSFYDDLYGGFNNVIDLVGTSTPSGYNDKDPWYKGAIAMHVDGIWHYAQLVANAPDKHVLASLMPYNADNPDATVRNIVEGAWAYSIPSGAKNPDASWLLVKYATAGDGNKNFFMAQGRPSPVIAFNEDPAMAGDNPHWDAYIANMDKSEKSEITPVSGQINELITRMTEEALMKVKTPEQALNDAAAEAQQILDEFWAGK